MDRSSGERRLWGWIHSESGQAWAYSNSSLSRSIVKTLCIQSFIKWEFGNGCRPRCWTISGQHPTHSWWWKWFNGCIASCENTAGDATNQRKAKTVFQKTRNLVTLRCRSIDAASCAGWTESERLWSYWYDAKSFIWFSQTPFWVKVRGFHWKSSSFLWFSLLFFDFSG